MLTELCAELRNYFLLPNGIHRGIFTIGGGTLAPLDFLKEGQYFRIVGSVLNDGVYQYPNDKLTDETFKGAIWVMAVPPTVVALASDIKTYCADEASKPSPYISESFGGYSYTKTTDSNGAVLSWEKAFADRLKPYRRMRIL